jgi:hypothetical protein
MNSFSGIRSYYVEDDFDGKCVVSGPCRLIGVQVSRASPTGTNDIQLKIYDQGGTVGSGATPVGGNLKITLNWTDEGSKENTPYYLSLPSGTAVKMDNGIVVWSADSGDAVVSTCTILYQQ